MTSPPMLLELLNGELSWLNISQPVFYQHEFSLRVGLELDDAVSAQRPRSADRYTRQIEQAVHRCCEVYRALIDSSDSMLVVAEVILPLEKQPAAADKFKLWRKYLRESISQRHFDRVRVDDQRLHDAECHRFLYSVSCRGGEIRFEELIRAIVIQDFPRLFREPIVKEPCYFIDLDKNTCLQVYDDRGLDVASKKPDVLLPLYRQFDDWLLDHDLERMHSVFSNMIL